MKRGGRGPKEKGAAFERNICQRLSLWVSGLTREDVFWRSAMSGGRATLRSRKLRGDPHQEERQLQAHAGDITATHPLGHLLLEYFLLECKFLKDLRWSPVVHGVQGELTRLWFVPSKQAADMKRWPMVIARQNFQPPLVLLNREGRQWLRAGLRQPPFLPVQASFPRYGLHVSLLSDLLGGIDFAMIRRVHEVRRKLR